MHCPCICKFDDDKDFHDEIVNSDAIVEKFCGLKQVPVCLPPDFLLVHQMFKGSPALESARRSSLQAAQFFDEFMIATELVPTGRDVLDSLGVQKTH